MTRVTLIELLVVIAIIVALAGLLLVAIWNAPPRPAGAAPPQAQWLRTKEYEGHWWVIGTHWGTHHPDCPCLTRRAEAAE
jgi:hypothetical protein